MNLSSKKLSAICLFCLLFSASMVNAQSFCSDIAIDEFSSSTVTPIDVDGSQPLVEVIDDGGSGTIGRFRSITVEWFSGVGATLLISGNLISLSNDAGASSRASILYNADGAGLGLDLSSRELLRLSIFDLDNGIDLTYILTDENANQATFTEAASGISEPVVQFLFEDFSNIQNVDLSSIESVELIIESTTNSADAALETTSFGCQGTPPEFVAVPTLNQYGYLAMVLSLLLLGALGIRKTAVSA